MQSDDFSEMPIVISCKITDAGITIMKVHIDNGSSIDIVYEQCFIQLPESIKANLQPTAVSLTGFAGEYSLPIGILPLDIELVDVNDDAFARKARLDFYVMRASSRYNMLLGSIMPICAAVNVKSAGQEIADDADNMEIINLAYPEQKIKVGRNVSADTRKQIVQLLVQYMDVFAWCENDMTGVPRHIAEHRLTINPALKPIVQKRRGMAPDRVKWLCDEVTKLVRAGILREVQYQSWIANPVFVKKPDGYHQIPMAQENADKAAFHTAYVDDLVIKSTMQEQIIEDMRETFDTLRNINMKLNPIKCSFGETEGKFLGYLVTEQGIQANPKKIAAIENMTAPRTVKEVQSLTGKLAALTHFLSKAAERQLPFFKTLKGCLKQKCLVWSSEAETTFQEMKKLLKTLPTLIAPVDGEILYLYISVENEAFGSVLIAERNKIQKPVYFTRIVGSRVRYQISYLPRSAVKGQVMTDYLAEMSGELEVVNERTALKPAEYEALLAGLNIARKMNITKLCAFTDSQLVANQFNGSFEAHDPSMQKYLQLLKEMAACFEHFKLAPVPRSQNKKADALSKLAALTFSHFQKQVWVEELPSKSVDSDLMVASVTEAQPNWMEPILQYIRNDILPSDSREARLVREREPMYIIQNDILYCKSYCGPMMRCIGLIKAEMIVEEVHNGTCALHSGYKIIAAKIMRMGYF
ncbi:uncharacterized protein [Rutidosis leptorrhynchoides]|uniref:uncharacterized protein n=1 Tax=Rutidosis leptorrhynchoides TaxID=125765 RepID=UPI003A99B813